jgi:hypothetical protein
VAAVLDRMGRRPAETLTQVLALDAEARRCAEAMEVARAA